MIAAIFTPPSALGEITVSLEWVRRLFQLGNLLHDMYDAYVLVLIDALAKHLEAITTVSMADRGHWINLRG